MRLAARVICLGWLAAASLAGPARAEATREDRDFLFRMGLLEGHLTPESSFTGNDHRRHRPREWLLDGLRKVDQLEFLRRDGRRTLAQAAMKWILAQPAIACVVHTVNTVDQLEEWAAAGGEEVPDLDRSELDRVQELYRSGFGLAASAATG